MESDDKLKFNSGDVIFSAGDASSKLFIIRNGQVGIFKAVKDGIDIPIGVLKSGEFLGELSLLQDKPHSSKAVALTDVELAAIPKDKVQAVLKDSPTWVATLLQSVIGRLQKTNDLLKKNNVIDSELNEDIESIKSNFQKKKAKGG